MSDTEKNIPETEENNLENVIPEAEEIVSEAEESVAENDALEEEAVSENEEIPEEDESFEDIFSSLREKYNLEPFGEEKHEETPAEDEMVFYNPAEDNEIDDFFKSREENYTALYEEVDAKIAGVDDEVLKREAEVFNIHFEKEKANEEIASDTPTEFEDVYSESDSAEEEDLEETKVIPEINEAEAVEEEETPAPEAQPIEEEAPQENQKNKKGSLLPRSYDSTGEKIRKIVFLISIIALIASSAWLINDYFIQPYLIQKQNEAVIGMIADAEKSDPAEMVEKLNNLDPEEKVVTFESLKKANIDFEGWLVMPGANISLPVVQANDNSKYLNTGFNGKWLSGGTAFIDSGNKNPFEGDMNTTIYGHNMRDGSMFGTIKAYKDVEAFKKNPFIYVYTENENYVYKIYSVFLSSAVKTDDNGYVFGYTFKNLSTDENFMSYMEEVKMRSFYNTGVDYQAGDQILTLSTCDRTVMKNGRLVVVARLIRENEQQTIDLDSVMPNLNPKYPAAWYQKKNKVNPYQNSVKWIAQ